MKVQEEGYNLTWNMFSDHLRNMLLNMMKITYLTDVTIICDDQKIVKAHKIILSACSPVFKTIIDSVSPETAVIFLRGIKLEDMEAILEFMYSGQVTLDQTRIEEFITVAKNLQIKELYDLHSNTELDNKEEVVNGDNDIEHVKTKKDTEEQSFYKQYQCKYEQCDFVAKSSAMLNHVKRVHTGQKYGCILCEKQFTRQFALRDHVNLIHNGIRNYQCHNCSYQTSKKGNLKVHVDTVHGNGNGENRFKCDVCDYSTMIHSNLKQHTKAKHKHMS